MLRSLYPVLALIELAYWKFTTFGIDPMAPHKAKAVIRVNEILRGPM